MKKLFFLLLSILFLSCSINPMLQISENDGDSAIFSSREIDLSILNGNSSLKSQEVEFCEASNIVVDSFQGIRFYRNADWLDNNGNNTKNTVIYIHGYNAEAEKDDSWVTYKDFPGLNNDPYLKYWSSLQGSYDWRQDGWNYVSVVWRYASYTYKNNDSNPDIGLCLNYTVKYLPPAIVDFIKSRLANNSAEIRLVGHSMGGRVATITAHKIRWEPYKVDRLTLLDPWLDEGDEHFGTEVKLIGSYWNRYIGDLVNRNTAIECYNPKSTSLGIGKRVLSGPGIMQTTVPGIESRPFFIPVYPDAYDGHFTVLGWYFRSFSEHFAPRLQWDSSRIGPSAALPTHHLLTDFCGGRYLYNYGGVVDDPYMYKILSIFSYDLNGNSWISLDEKSRNLIARICSEDDTYKAISVNSTIRVRNY